MSGSVESWVAAAKEIGIDEWEFRQAVHTVLHAIGESEGLRGRMLIKGGVLLAIRYGSDRFTRDVDFSTEENNQQFNQKTFLDIFTVALADAVEQLGYQLDCRVQSWKMKPPRPDDSFPTLEVKVAHALFGSKKHRHLQAGKCSTVLSLDYSLNEYQLFDSEEIDLGYETSVWAYSLPDLIGEKFRAMLQVEERNRVRGQDAYDIYVLLADTDLEVEFDTEIRSHVLQSLVAKAAARGIAAHPESLDAIGLIKRLRQGYDNLAQTLPSDAPPFDIILDRVHQYYVNLPWSDGDPSEDSTLKVIRKVKRW